MQTENHSPLQEGDNSKIIRLIAFPFLKQLVGQCNLIKVRSFDPFPLDPLVVI